MRYHKSRRNKFRSNDRGFRRNGSKDFKLSSMNHTSGSLQRRPFNRNGHNPEKLLEKYNSLAKEALSKGDKILSENYYQHADHFLRVVGSRNSNENSSAQPSVNDDAILEGEKETTVLNPLKTEKS